MGLKIGELMLLLFLAARSDLKEHKVKNKLIVSFMVVGICTNAGMNGISGIYESIFGAVIPIVILIFFYAIRTIGAGDVKLFSAVGAVMGTNFILNNMIFSILTNGVIALGLMIIRKNGIKRMKYLFHYLKACFMVKGILPYSKIDNNDDGKFCFAVGIFLASIIQIGIFRVV